jgi:hypothetical protein
MKLGLAAAVLVALAGTVPVKAAVYDIQGVVNVGDGLAFDINLIGDPNSGGSYSSGVFSLTLTSGNASVPPYSFALTDPKFTLNDSNGNFALISDNQTLLSFTLSSDEVAAATGSPTSFDLTTSFTNVVFNASAIGQNADITGSVTSFTAAVPESSTWAMMILGFFGVGFMAYRRKSGGPTLRFV